MKSANVLTSFIAAIQKDPRIGISHIGLFAALAALWLQQPEKAYLELYSKQVMLLAKISSSATYHKLIHDLDSFGYLNYEPCYYKRRASRIVITVKL